MKRLLVFAIHVYRRTLGALLPPMCRFDPTCSHYAEGCVQEHGAVKGSILACWRLIRCNPLGEYGQDPVPPKDAWRQAFSRRAIARANPEIRHEHPHASEG